MALANLEPGTILSPANLLDVAHNDLEFLPTPCPGQVSRRTSPGMRELRVGLCGA